MTLIQMNEQDPWSNPRSRKGASKSNDEAKRKEQDKENLPDWARPSDKKPSGGSRPSPPKGLIEELFNLFKKQIGDDTGGNSNGNGNKGGKQKGFGFRSIITGVGLAIALIWGGMGFYAVDEQERGVVLRFGKYVTTLGPGLRWQPYLIDKVIVINVTRVRSFTARGIMLTKNENIVDLTVEVQYDIEDARSFALRVRDPEMSIRQGTDSAMRHVVGGTNLDQVITEGRAKVAADVRERVQNYISDYGTGIHVVGVNIQKADPPQEVKPAFEDAISAREDEIRFRNQAEAYAKAIIPRARGEAQRVLEDGRAYKERTIARAQGDAQRFNLVYQAYAKGPAIMRRRLYLEAMEEILANTDKILIDVSGSNNLLYLPLDKFLQRPSATEGSAGRGNDNSLPQTGSLSESQLSRVVESVLKQIDSGRIQRNGR